jgi:hypothetical protein
MNELDTLAAAWSAAKTAEGKAVEARRAIEDRLVSLLEISAQFEGTANTSTEQGITIKIVGRLNRKVDTDRLQELATEHGLTEHLTALFRWSADINAAAWKSASAAITAPLRGAITTTAGRPSFSISTKDSK